MGEAADSRWQTPLHSSDTETHWQKHFQSKGHSGIRFNRSEAGHLPSVKQGDPLSGLADGGNASTARTNPFHKPTP